MEAAHSDVVIDVRGLNKHFGDNHAVRDLALTVRRGRSSAFWVPTEAARRTSIRMLCGLLTPDSGEERAWATTFSARPSRSSATSAT